MTGGRRSDVPLRLSVATSGTLVVARAVLPAADPGGAYLTASVRTIGSEDELSVCGGRVTC